MDVQGNQKVRLITFVLAVVGLLGGTVEPAYTQERTISFAGTQWTVRRSQGKEGPGPNYFMDGDGVALLMPQEIEGIQQSQRNELQLSAVKHPSRNRWFSTEIISQEPVGYGSYRIRLRIDEPGLDSRLIFGFFTYDQNPSQYHSEIDIELGYFGSPGTPWVHVSIQPSSKEGNSISTLPPRQWGTFVLEFQWHPGKVDFSVHLEETQDSESWIWKKTITGNPVPVPATPHLHTNLWFFQGQPPENDGALGIIIEDIRYTPLY
ncbi:glycoside hydrolase family 16 protein [Spirochaeta lutea]|uniref:Uncharacterized protein n=1 Tax=Spirochaeta lutea TaxID=1480694 RepID=A0A098QZV0_9SPIO|nr:glycoside hydrolase family 16 protein [Spirochaeta lutea]KGE72017.1 hypothetical protein DC28_07835 [Spirochaeta lutea]